MMEKKSKKLYIETYGCQMNFSDSEIIRAIMKDNNYDVAQQACEADIIFINTCSIRDNAEQRVRKKLNEYTFLKQKKPALTIGILGCMAERLKSQLLEEEKIADIIVGPDAYRDLPRLIQEAESGKKAVNVLLSAEETYEDISPVKTGENNISAFISIMRGCQNYCSYCVVPYTRGKERSRKFETILSEAKDLFEKGFREITLLGQNVNSYRWEDKEVINFARLLERVAQIHPLLRVRFATSHPKDISEELIKTMVKYPNICRAIHLPVQSGSNRILQLMNRKYTREWYMEKIALIKKHIPDCGISTDIICGFCTETDDDHRQSIALMQEVGFDYAFMFKYSERPETFAAKKYKDDVPENIKSTRLTEIINLQQSLSCKSNIQDIGKTFEVLIEGKSKKSEKHFSGRNSQNKVVVFPKKHYNAGEYVRVKILDCTTATLIGEIV